MFEEDSWDQEPSDELDDEFDDVAETVPCPNCGAEIYEEAERCPECGDYVTFGTNAWSGRPLWWIVLGMLGVVAMVIVLAGLGR